MSDIDFDRTARLWLQDGPSQLADRVLEAALDEIHVTRQRRALWPAWRFPSMSIAIRVAAVAAVLVVAVAGIRYFSPEDGGVGHPQASLSPLPSPRGTIVVGEAVSLQPGTYVTADDFLVRAGFTVPAGWDGNLGGPYALFVARHDGQAEVIISVFDKIYADPCHLDQGIADPAPGPTVDDLATAISTMPTVQVTTPTEGTLGGYAGKQLTITAPGSGFGCAIAQDGFPMWQLPLGATYTMAPGQNDRIWILDVGGQRIVIDAIEHPGETPQLATDVQGILDSIRLAPKPTSPKPS
jgi:hypothetical protein